MKYHEALKYLLEERQVSRSTLDEFNLAFCDPKGYLYAPTRYPKDFSVLNPMFLDCIVFPIYDLYGTCVAVMARRMHDSPSKYVNSANSNSFTKGKHLYGLHKSHPSILQKGYVIVTEGLFDFLLLYQNGITNVVSTMGTSLTNDHIALISRFTKKIIMLPDGDVAGTKFGNKSVIAAQRHVECVYLKLPTKQDPDEYVLQYGPDNFKQLIANL